MEENKAKNQVKIGIVIWPSVVSLIIGWLMLNLWKLFYSYWVVGVGSLLILPLLALQVKFCLNPVPVETKEDG